jgi:hypothetical protein
MFIVWIVYALYNNKDIDGSTEKVNGTIFKTKLLKFYGFFNALAFLQC